MENQIRLLAVLIKHRKEAATKVQEVLTHYGCNIKTRLGLHETTNDKCAPNGLIILELSGTLDEVVKMEKDLNAIESVTAKNITFDV